MTIHEGSIVKGPSNIPSFDIPRSAQARALEEKGKEYILPIRVDDTELEGLLPTLGYVSIKIGIDEIGEMLVKKLRSR